MKTGWKEVACLGEAGGKYPHVLVDAHGWCLRLGPKPGTDDKYYSGLPALMEGLVEHFLRRRWMEGSPVRGVDALLGEVRRTLAEVTTSAARFSERMGQELRLFLRQRPGARGTARDSRISGRGISVNCRN